jgi:hypothetical protein
MSDTPRRRAAEEHRAEETMKQYEDRLAALEMLEAIHKEILERKREADEQARKLDIEVAAALEAVEAARRAVEE